MQRFVHHCSAASTRINISAGKLFGTQANYGKLESPRRCMLRRSFGMARADQTAAALLRSGQVEISQVHDHRQIDVRTMVPGTNCCKVCLPSELHTSVYHFCLPLLSVGVTGVQQRAASHSRTSVSPNRDLSNTDKNSSCWPLVRTGYGLFPAVNLLYLPGGISSFARVPFWTSRTWLG